MNNKISERFIINRWKSYENILKINIRQKEYRESFRIFFYF